MLKRGLTAHMIHLKIGSTPRTVEFQVFKTSTLTKTEQNKTKNKKNKTKQKKKKKKKKKLFSQELLNL